jgi:fumarate reductase subunit C
MMRYLELVLYAFAKFVIWYSVVLLFGIVAVDVGDLSGTEPLCHK